MSAINCQKKTKVSKIKVIENRKSVTFLNPNNDTYVLTQHDGCLVENIVACDWVLSKEGRGDVFIELKGTDINHATTQILASVSYWKEHNLTHGKISGIIVGTQYPRITTQIQKAKQLFAKRHRGMLYIHSHNVECNPDQFFN